MSSRALMLATVILLIGCFAEGSPAHAQATNLEAGKSPSQIFAGTCTACHKSPRGLLKSVPAGSLPSFLRQHYTTSPDMAGLLSSFLISNGASDSRYGGGQGKPDANGRPGNPPQQVDRQGRPLHPATSSRDPANLEAEPRQVAKPDADGVSPQNEGGRKGRRRLARPTEEQAKPESEASEPGPDGRKLSAKQRLGRRGKPGDEIKETPKDDSAKGDAAKDDAVKGDAAKTGSGKDESAASTATRDDKPAGEAAKDEKAKPSDDGKPDTAKLDSAKETAPKAPVGQTSSMRADPVPASVTPAPAASVATPGGTQEPVTGATRPAAPLPPPAAQSAASEPASSSAPAAASSPAGPPEPPISR